ncbi:MAG: GNAT family N-acetyltransferase [Pirellulales bacterium]|nr:GNAT family N-acetyltransferase [Pirellulales bacterium]
MFQTEIIDRPDDLNRIAARWDTLVANSDFASPFRSSQWMRSWWQHYGHDKRLCVVTVNDGDDLLGVAPAFITRSPAHVGTRALKFLGTGQACGEYLGLIVRDGRESTVVPAILDTLTTDLAGAWDVLRLSDIPADSPQCGALAAYFNQCGLHWSQRAGTTNLVVEFPGDWDTFLASVSSKRRTKLRRVVKTFDRDFTGEYEIATDKGSYERVWPELERLHNLHWSDAGKQGCFETPAFREMHRAFSQQALIDGKLVLASLRVHGQAIAACYGIRQGDTIYEYQRGHDPAWLAHRPGHALQYHMFREFMNDGVRRWDYLRGDYQHKRDWATTSQSTVDLFAAAPRCLAAPRYFAEHTYRNVRQRVKRWRDRVKVKR